MSGSGMGCPDWPKCFGQYIPPTEVEQLPDNYLEEYSNKRREKNERLAAYLSSFGFSKLAHRIANDQSVYEEEEFNVWKTYIEYINRLIGAISGLFLLALFVWSVRLYSSNKKLLLLSGILLIAILLQAWFGSIVVSTNLLPGTISVHMFLALVIVILLLHLERLSSGRSRSGPIANKSLYYILVFAVLLSLIQIFMGTQVRQEIDVLARSLGYETRDSWIDKLSTIFYVHRSFSILIILINGYIAYKLYRLASNSKLYLWVLGIISIEIVTGTIMAYFAIPRAMQASHLVLASLMFGLQYYALINFRRLQSIQSSQ